MAVEVHIGKGALPGLQSLERFRGWWPGCRSECRVAVELPEPYQGTDPRVKQTATPGVVVEGPSDQWRECSADGGGLAPRQTVVHPREFACAEGIPVSFGNPKAVLYSAGRGRSPTGFGVANLQADVGTKGRKAVLRDDRGIAAKQPGHCHQRGAGQTCVQARRVLSLVL